MTLPIQLDLGTDTKEVVEGQHYLGNREKRIPDEAYYAFIDEFLLAVKAKWPTCLLQFEDFSNNHCFELLDRYRQKLRCFNDDIQGTGAVIASGFITATKVTKIPYHDQRIVFLGAGSAGIGVADQIVAVMCKEDATLTPKLARERFFFVDSKGLVTKTRGGDALEKHKIPYARTDMTQELKTLLEVIQHVKPTALIGLSGVGGSFPEPILKEAAKHHPKPIIFALSNPTTKSECSAESAYHATEGRAIFASGSPFPVVKFPDGREIHPGQGNNMYIFPGLGFGAWLAQVKEVTDGMLIAATITLSSCVTPEDLALGRVYPNLERIREISAKIATKVMEVAFEEGMAQIPRPADIHAFVSQNMYQATY
jgi:malic enzyme